MTRTKPFKTCGCGRTHATLIDWLSLRFVGLMDDGDGGHIELRDCPCRSTLAIEAPRVTYLGVEECQ